LLYYGVSDRGLLVEILRVYNEYIAEFASQAPERIKAVGLLNPDDLPGAVRMAQRMKADGFGGLMLPVKALDGHTYDSAEFEPLWEAIEGLEMPLTVHIAAHRSPLAGHLLFARIGEGLLAPDYIVRVSIMDMIFSGVFERHPNLKVVSVEHEGSWVFHYLQRMDWHYVNNRMLQDGYRFKDGRLPSDFFRQNVVISFTEDPFLIANRNVVGVDNLAWGSDFPHDESLYSMSHASLAQQFDGVPEDERIKISVTNTAHLYGLELPPVRV
jgi:predicted TIM-barrel fold metal-dependent hydrolase